MSSEPKKIELEPLVVETASFEPRKLGLFRRAFGYKHVALKCVALVVAFLALCAMAGVVGHLARVVAVLIEERKSMDGQGISGDLFDQFNMFEQY